MHVKSNLCNLICLKHLIRSRAVINSYGNLYAFIRAQRMKPRNHIMIDLFGLRLQTKTLQKAQRSGSGHDFNCFYPFAQKWTGYQSERIPGLGSWFPNIGYIGLDIQQAGYLIDYNPVDQTSSRPDNPVCKFPVDRISSKADIQQTGYTVYKMLARWDIHQIGISVGRISS